MTWCCSHDTVRAVLSYFEDYIQVSVNKILSDQLRDMHGQNTVHTASNYRSFYTIKIKAIIYKAKDL